MFIDSVIGDKYRVTQLIGQGGMGTVFEAVHTGTGARVAIKMIVAKDVQEERFVRFQREARAVGAIDSQHIVRVFDMGTDEQSGTPYMVMERLYGEDLSQLMKRVGPLEPKAALTLIAQAALGLAKAHEAGIVHRDIKLANLFLHEGGDTGEVVVKILDFGIAKVLMDAMQHAEEGGLTRTGSMLGSPHYMSPEQAQGLRTIDHRSDIWSLGVVLYKMLTGQTPHAHMETLGQVILAICSKSVRPVQDLAPWVSPEIAAIVHQALQPNPDQRFQSAYEIYLALQPLIAGLPPLRRVDIIPLSNTQRASVAEPLTLLTASPLDTPTDRTNHSLSHTRHDPAPQKQSRSFVALMAVAGVMAAVGLAGIGVSLLARKPAIAATSEPAKPPPPPTAEKPPETPPTVTPTAERTVTVHITPSNAVVTVDGKKRELVGGSLSLSGPLGAMINVRVVAGGMDTTQPIAITEGGAIPPRIALTSQPTVRPAAPISGGKNGAGVKPSPGPSGTGVNVQRSFE